MPLCAGTPVDWPPGLRRWRRGLPSLRARSKWRVSCAIAWLGEHRSAAADGAPTGGGFLAHRAHRPRSRAEIVRERLIEGVRPVRSLLKALVRLPWEAPAAHPLLEALGVLRGLYERDKRDLPVSSVLPVGRVWKAALEGPDRERALAALEVATLLNLRRALRNGSVWIEHSLGFRSRETLFIPEPRWQQSRRTHYRRLSLPTDPKDFLDPLIE